MEEEEEEEDRIRIRNTGPAGCNARFHITFSYLNNVMVG
jgi:hypothetical protein